MPGFRQVFVRRTFASARSHLGTPAACHFRGGGGGLDPGVSGSMYSRESLMTSALLFFAFSMFHVAFLSQTLFEPCRVFAVCFVYIFPIFRTYPSLL